jgi:hypothetical protein
VELEYDYWTGSDTQVINSLNRSIGQYFRHYKKVKLGICNNPEQTKSECCKCDLDLDWMIIKYKTKSKDIVIEIIETLSDNNRDCSINNKQDRSTVINDNYYFYVLLKE